MEVLESLWVGNDSFKSNVSVRFCYTTLGVQGVLLNFLRTTRRLHKFAADVVLWKLQSESHLFKFVRSARRGGPESQYRTCVKIGDNIRYYRSITRLTGIPVSYRGYESEGDESDGGT